MDKITITWDGGEINPNDISYISKIYKISYTYKTYIKWKVDLYTIRGAQYSETTSEGNPNGQEIKKQKQDLVEMREKAVEKLNEWLKFKYDRQEDDPVFPVF